jgi:hypothetical protein
MNIVSKITKPAVAGLAIVCFIMGIAAVANAIPPNQVFQTFTNRTITGKCCFSWGESVTVSEPAQITPVVVTLSTDYQSTKDFNVGIALNGHPCQFSGPSDLEFWPPAAGFKGRTLQWVILPSDGLIKGNNTITLCGGGISSDSDAITLGYHTMAVTISK